MGWNDFWSRIIFIMSFLTRFSSSKWSIRNWIVSYLNLTVKVNSVQEACAKCFAIHILKFEILQTTWKNKTKNIKILDLLLKNRKLTVWCSLFHFSHVIARFQVLISEPESIWRKLLVLSWLYTTVVFESWKFHHF